jgi:hypothetical protein
MNKPHFIVLILSVFLFSCSDSGEIGKWDDNIKLSQKEVQFTSAENSVVITTGQDGWWLLDVSLDGNTDFEPSENSEGLFLLEENEFIVERRSPKEIYIEMSANSTGSERILQIGLQNGNYFDGIKITQAAK